MNELEVFNVQVYHVNARVDVKVRAGSFKDATNIALCAVRESDRVRLHDSVEKAERSLIDFPCVVDAVMKFEADALVSVLEHKPSNTLMVGQMLLGESV